MGLSHSWQVSLKEAKEIQEKLRQKVITQDRLGNVQKVAGVDAICSRDEGNITAAAVVLSYPDLKLINHAVSTMKLQFPYVPGLLSFREAPVILSALKKLKEDPDLIICDGQGIAHPRRFGIACHIGVLTGIPSIGVAKKRLWGEHDLVSDKKGSWVPLKDKGELIGVVLRTRRKVKPVFVSPGHKISLKTATYYVIGCVKKYRLPEPIRWAHRLAGEKRLMNLTRRAVQEERQF